MNETYFFDTYALIEIIKGNSNYKHYHAVSIILTKFNLIELHYSLLRQVSRHFADSVVDEFSNYVVDVEIDSIKEASMFKRQHKKEKLSLPDAVGYIVAKKLGIKFLTGDKQFENKENVEFVK